MPAGTIPYLINFIVVVLLGVIVWGLWRVQSPPGNTAALIVEPPSDMLVWLFALAAFIFGVFVAYVWVRP